MATYTPQPGTVASRVVAWLKARPSGEFNAAQISEALGLNPAAILSSIEQALDAKLVYSRQRDRTSLRAPRWYSATDQGAHQRRQGFGNSSEWMPTPKKDTPVTPQGDQAGSEPAREVMEPAACESADGRGTNGAPALATLPLHASPGVGPMGAGQPADAGPTEEDQRSGGVDGHAAADEARAYSKAIPTALDTIPSMRPKGVPPGETQSQGSRAAGVESGPLHHDEQPREVDAQFAATLAAAMDFDDDHLPPADLAATRRAVHAPRVGLVPLAFRCGRFSDGSLHLERDGAVIASLSAAEVDVLVQLLGARA